MHDGCYIDHFPFDSIDDAIGETSEGDSVGISLSGRATRWDVAESVRRLIQPSPRTLVQPLSAIFIEQCSLADFLLRGEIEADTQ
jgi:hypothetical protein